MKKITLKRIKGDDNYTLGEIYYEGKLFCYSLERGDRNNLPFISRIPQGEYFCRKFSGEKYKNVIKVLNVKDRDAILIHTGNYYWDVQGCILVGDSWEEAEVFNKLTKKKEKTIFVKNSQKTFDKFIKKFGYSFELIIEDEKKMALLSTALIGSVVSKLGIKLFDKLKEKAKEKALEKFGDILNTKYDVRNEKDVERIVNDESLKEAVLIEAKKTYQEVSKNETEQMRIVNETMRQEMQSESWLTRNWRPCVCFGGLFYLISFLYLSILGNKDIEIITILGKIALSIVGFMSSVAIGRSFEKSFKIKKNELF